MTELKLSASTIIEMFPEPTTFGGTSAAAPFVSGVAGWIGEAFLNRGTKVNNIPPERIKAILIHTAQDVGISGPDFNSGYGLIQPTPALRIAEEWSDWGREGTLDETVTELAFEFTVDKPMFQYKATLVWTDEQGDFKGDIALRNDLDLRLVGPAPSNEVFRPFNLTYPAGATFSAEPCDSEDCEDRLNNVEQVVVSMPDGSEIPRGTWTAYVDFHRLVTDEQPFSLVLTLPCPVVITQDVTLTDDLSCETSERFKAAVEIKAPDVTFNCGPNNHQISGVGNVADSIGIHVLASDAKVKNCDVTNFDRGSRIGKSQWCIGFERNSAKQ